MQRNSRIIFIAILVSVQALWVVSQGSSQTVVELELKSYRNPSGRLFDGDCCDASTSLGGCSTTDQCDLFFTLCLDDSADASCSGVDDDKVFSFSASIANANSITFPLQGFNPYAFRLDEPYTGSVTLKVFVYDSDSVTGSQLVDSFRAQYSPDVASTNRDSASPVSFNIFGERSAIPSRLQFAVSVYCDSNYYDDQCSTYCLPNDNCGGHYTCDPDTGAQVCLPGWMGADCTERMDTSDQLCVASLPVNQSPCEMVDVVFILDISGSINNIDAGNWAMMQSFVKAYAAQYETWGPNGVQMGVVLMGNNGVLAIQLNSHTDVASFQDNVDALVYREQKTNIQGALDVTRMMAFSELLGDRPDAYDVAIMITDGEIQNPEFGPLDDRVMELRDSGVEVFVIAHTDFLLEDQNSYADLRRIASEPLDDHVFFVGNFQAALMAKAPEIKATVGDSCEAQAESAGPAAVATSFSGLWTGFYTCNGLNISLEAVLDAVNGNGVGIGVMTFFNNSVSATLNISVLVRTENNRVIIQPLTPQFNSNPFGLSLLGLDGEYDPDMAVRQIEGTVTLQDCGSENDFVLTQFISQVSCLNGGTCVVVDEDTAEFYCCCAEGFTGNRCEIRVTICNTNPCGPGICVPIGASNYSCECPTGYSGENCEIVGSPISCDDNPCDNPSTCATAGPDDFQCVCPGQVTGDTCELTLSIPCPMNYYGPDCDCRDRNDCSGHYTCNRVTGDKECLPGWVGADCTEKDPAVLPDPDCPMNGCGDGTCFDGQCCCPDVGLAAFCNVTVNETCVPTDSCEGHYNCDPEDGSKICLAGWTGEDCNMRDFGGLSDPQCPRGLGATGCLNGGTCFDGECCCREGYGGVACQTDILECASNPCGDGGFCRDELGFYTCICKPDYTGVNCEVFLGTIPTVETSPADTTTMAPTTRAAETTTQPGTTDGLVTSPIATTAKTTGAPSTAAPTTAAPTTAAPTTAVPTTAAPTTEGPTTARPTTAGPTTAVPTTAAPTTAAVPTTAAPTSKAPTTVGPSTAATREPSTTPPTTLASSTPGVVIDTTLKTGSPQVTSTAEPVRTTAATTAETTVVMSTSEAPTTPMVSTTVVVTTTGEPCISRDDCMGHYTCDNDTNAQICLVGWTGVDCVDTTWTGDFNPDCPEEAEFGNCKNGGTCFNDSCCCVPGYEGVLCESEIIECLSDPCQNGARCLDELNGFVCVCQPGFYGVLCENTDMELCVPRDDCEGHYSCAGPFGPIECLPGWTGINCIDSTFVGLLNPECPDLQSATQCKNGGTCFDRTCCCVAGYEGLVCEMETVECDSDPCQNGGFCRDELNGYTCFCPEGVSGENCEFSNETMTTMLPTTEAPTPQPCLTDEDSCLGHYTCDVATGNRVCLPGFKGPECTERDFDGRFDPFCPQRGAGIFGCKNEGHCFEQQCCCVPGYVGDICETDFQECDSNPCQNGGTCQDLVNFYVCYCLPGFTGSQCEESTATQPTTAFTTVPRTSMVTTGVPTSTKVVEPSSEAPTSMAPSTVQPTTAERTTAIPTTVAPTTRAPPTTVGPTTSEATTSAAPTTVAPTTFAPTSVSPTTVAPTTVAPTTVAPTTVAPTTAAPTTEQRTTAPDTTVAPTTTGVPSTAPPATIEPCFPTDSCEGHYSCDNTTDAKICLMGYKGDDCKDRDFVIIPEQFIFDDQCPPGGVATGCKNGGTCWDQTCCCVAGYEGDLCEQETIECDSDPCQNGGFCRDELDRYECICLPGFFGVLCELSNITLPTEGPESTQGPTTAIQPTTEGPSTVGPSTEGPTTQAPTTKAPTTEVPTTRGPTTQEPTTQVPTTEGPTTQVPTTEGPTTQVPTTEGPTTQVPTTEGPTTKIGTTEGPTTGIPSIAPTTLAPTTVARPTTVGPTTAGPTTAGPTTAGPASTEGPTTSPGATTTEPVTSAGPTTRIDTTEAVPTTVAPTFGPCSPRDDCEGHYECDNVTSERLCLEGYNGPDCKLRVFIYNIRLTDPECPSLVGQTGCRNGGTCFNQGCCCLPGYEGTICETEIIECESSPCQNDGVCIDEIDGYDCLCENPYTGVNCETGPEPCMDRDDCMGHYTCTGVLQFECLDGWRGADCTERDWDELIDSECPVGFKASGCANGGTCFDETCCCPAGFTGPLCETEIIECDSEPCQNGGMCRDFVNYYECDCPPGYSGVNCEETNFTTTPAPTTEPPPQNETCVPMDSCEGHIECPVINGFVTVQCLPGYTGEACTDREAVTGPDNQCPHGSESSGCKFGGTCWDRTCCCVDGYEGPLCESEIIECESNPCQNGGSCIDEIGFYVCLCAEGYSGDNCENSNITETTVAVPTTAKPTTGATTEAPVPTTVQTTAKTTAPPVVTTPVATTTAAQPTTAVTTAEITTEPGTPIVTSPPETTAVPPTTVAPTTAAPTTVAPTTVAPTTVAPTTVAPTTVAPTTVAPTTVAPTTVAPTTVAPTTVAPTTVAPTTVTPTTVAPTTVAPTTVAPTTVAPTTQAPTTKASPTTQAPTTQAPTTAPAPTTEAPTTEAPTTLAPTTTEGIEETTECFIVVGNIAISCDDPSQITIDGVAQNLTAAELEQLLALVIEQIVLGQGGPNSAALPQARSGNAVADGTQAASSHRIQCRDYSQELLSRGICVINVTNSEIAIIQGTDGRFRTVIRNLEFTILNETGHDITSTFQTDELRIALSEALGTTFEIIVNEDGEQEIAEKDPDPDNVGVINLDANFELELILQGLYLDFQFQTMFQTGLYNAYRAANVGAFEAVEAKNLSCLVPRVDETTGVVGADFSLVYFYFVYDDATAQDEIGYLAPNDLTRPSNADITAALEAVGFTNIVVQSAPSFKNIQNSFGIFIDGPMFDEDIQAFLDVMQQFWRTQQGDKYSTVTCEAGFIEKYFTSIETDLDTTVMWREVTRFGYYVKRTSGQLVTPFEVGLRYPSETRVQTYVADNSLTLTDQFGAAYSFLVRDDLNIDHTTLSTNELRRAKEAFTLYVNGDVSPLDFSEIAATLQTKIRGVGEKRTFARVLNFTEADVRVVQTQKVFSMETQSSYTAVMSYISRTLTDGSVSIFDGRRVAMSLPSVEDMMPQLSAITAPDGSSYSFLTEAQVSALGMIRTEQDLFVALVEGNCYSADYERFEASIHSALRDTLPEIFDQDNYQEVIIDIYGNEEVISMDDGASLSALFYSVSMYEQGETVYLSRETRVSANISVETLQANVAFERIDGSSYTFRESSSYAMSVSASYMYPLYTPAPVVTSDLSLIAEELQTYYESVLTDIGTFTVTVPRQEENKGMERSSVTRLCIFIMSDNYGAIAPVTIPASVTDATIASSVSVTGPAGAYEFLTDAAFIGSLRRVNELFSFGLTTDVAMATEQGLVQALVEASATTLSIESSSITINIMAVDEWVLTDRSSAYNVMFECLIDGEFISARSFAPLAPADLTTAIATVSLPSGDAYTTVSIDFSTSFFAASLVVTPFNRPLVATAASFESVAAVFIRELYTSVSTAYSEITEADISIEIIRQREAVTEDMGTAFLVDCVVVMGPDRLYPAVFPDLPMPDIVSALPVVPTGGVAYDILNVEMSDTFELDMAFSITLDVFALRMSDLDAIETAIGEALGGTTAFAGLRASGSLSVEVVSVQPVIDAMTGASFTNVYYVIVLDDWLVLNANVEAQVDISLLSTEIGQITAPSGSSYVVVTADVEIYRRSENWIAVLEGPFSKLDWAFIANLGAGIIADAVAEYSVTVIQVNELITDAGARLSEVMCIIQDQDGGIVLPLTLPQLDMDRFEDDLAGDAESGSRLTYSLVDISSSSMVITDIRNCFIMYLNATFIQAADIVTIETSFQTVFSGMADFASFGTLSVSMTGQFEMIGPNREVLIEIPLLVQSASGMVISSHVIPTLIIANLNAGFNVAITGTDLFYSASLSTLAVEELAASLDYRDLGLIVLDKFIAEDQLSVIQAAVLAIYESHNTDYELNIEIQKVERCFGAGASGFGIFFSARDNGNFLLPIDLAVGDMDAAMATFVGSLRTNAGGNYSLVTEITRSTVVRMSQTVSGVFGLSRPLQPSDTAILGALFSQVVGDALSVSGVSGSVVVRVLDQFTFVTSESKSNSYYDVILGITVDGEIFDSRAFPGLNMDEVMALLPDVTYTGTELTFADIAINIEALQVSIVYLNSLSFIPIVEPLPAEAFATLRAALDEYCAAELSIPADDIEITIWLQEEISNGDITMWQIAFGLEVRVDGELRLLDARGMMALDLAKLFAFIETSTSYSALVDVGLLVAVDVDIESIVRLEEANLICFTNELANGDINTVMSNIKALYIDIDSAFEDAEFSLVKTEIATTADRTRLNCFYYLAELDGVFIQQLPDPTRLSALLSSSVTSHQQEYSQYVETRDSVVISQQSLFTLYMTSFIRDEDAEAVFSAITDAWTTFAGESVTVSFITQYEVYFTSGALMIEVKYSVRRGDVFLNANFEASVQISALVQALRSVSVSGVMEATTYDSFVYQGAVTDTVLKSSLCKVVLSQKVATSQYIEFNRRLHDAWRVVDSSVSGVTVYAQEEVIVSSSYSAWVLYFRGVGDNNGPLECINTDQNFIQELLAGLSDLQTMRGEAFTLVPLSEASAAVSIEQGFSLYFTTTIVLSDLQQIAAAIQETWISSFSETVDVDITVQQEYVSMSGETVFRVVFFVRSESGLLFDARLIAGLTSTQISDLLSRVENTMMESTYADLQYTGQVSALYAYDHRFTLDFTREVVNTHRNLFVDVIKTVFVQERLFAATSDVLAVVVKLEEVFDITGQSYFQLVYFIKEAASMVVVDARVTPIIAHSVWSTAIEEAAILDAQERPYEIAVNIEMPVYRLEQSHSLVVMGRVQYSQNSDFASALQTVWRTVSGFSSVEVAVVTQLEMVVNNQFATSIVYMLENDNSLVVESMVSAISSSDVIDELGSDVTNVNGDVYVVVDNIEVLRYRHHFGVFLTSPVLEDDVAPLMTRLLEEWERRLPALSPLSIKFGLQEEMLTQSGTFVWQFVYFLEYGTGDDVTVINSNLFSHLSVDRLEAALSLGVSESSEEYVDLALTADVVAGLLRVEDLFSVYVTSAVIRTQYEEFAEKITQVWTAFNSEFSADVTVVAVDKYLTGSSTFVYRLYYKAEANGNLVISRLMAAPEVSDFTSAIAEIDSLQGPGYVVLDPAVMTVRRYSSAFYTFLVMPVTRQDQSAVLENLKEALEEVLGSDIGLSLVFGIQEEFIGVSGESVWRFSYFATSTNIAVHNAQFSTGIARSNLQAIFSTQQVFLGDAMSLVNFADLLGVAVTTRVATERFSEFASAIQQVYDGFTEFNDLGTVSIEVVTQEEYLTAEGEFVYNILYVVRVNDMPFGPIRLPRIPVRTDFSAIGSIRDLSQDNYVLSTVEQVNLRRFKAAMSFFVSEWVSRASATSLLSEIETTVTSAFSGMQGAISISFAAQEWFFYSGNSPDTPMYPVRFSFFVSVDNSLINGALEAAIDTSGLTSVADSVLSSANVDGALNLRDVFSLNVDGFVPEDDEDRFVSALTGAWGTLLAGIRVDFAARMEYIGERGVPVHSLKYFLYRSDDTLVLPGQIANADVSNLNVASSVLMVGSQPKVYGIYEGLVVPYDTQFSVLIHGEITTDVAEDILAAIMSSWDSEITGKDIELELTKLELGFADLGALVTRLLYTVKVNGVPTFPANDASPDVAPILRGLDYIRLYEESASVVRLEDHFALPLEGTLQRSVKDAIQSAIAATWSGAGTGTPTVTLGGRQLRWATGASGQLNHLFYRLTRQSDGSIIYPYQIQAPANDQFGSSLPADIGVYRGATLKVQSVLLVSRLTDTEITRFESTQSQLWRDAQGAGSFQANATVDSQSSYATAAEVAVSKTFYAVSLNGFSPELLVPPGIVPTLAATSSALSAAGIPSTCGCLAKKTFRIYISGNNIRSQEDEINSAVQGAWSTTNQGMSVGTTVMISGSANRKKRNTGNDVTFTDSQGNVLTPVDYVVDAGGSDPDPFFMETPSLDAIAAAIQDNTEGLTVCTQACTPNACSTIMLEDKLTDRNIPDIERAVTAAYVEANAPGMAATDLDITITIVDNDLEDQNDKPMTEVQVCVSRTDGGSLDDVVQPDDDTLDDKLRDEGFRLADDGAIATESSSDVEVKWIVIIIVICSVAAVVIVILAVVKVIHRKRQWGREDDVRSAYESRILKDEEDYAGHATAYNSPIYGGTFKSHNGSLSSKVQFYDDRGMIFPS